MYSRRLLALLLSLLLVFSVLPAVTLAAGGFEENSGECPNGGTHHWIGNYLDEPTCTEPGVITWYCDKCYRDRESEVSPLGHDWSEWETITEPTCSGEGLKVRHCNRCGIREGDCIPALGHDWQEQTVAEKAATCTENGYRQYNYVCTRCGASSEVHQDDYPALEHNWGEWITHLEPTCEDEGKRHHTCKRCNWTGNGTLPALGHDWDDGVITKTPTPEEPGEMTYTCKRDPSHTYTVEIPYDETIPDPPLPPPVTAEPEPDPIPPPTEEPEAITGLTLTAEITGSIKATYQEGDPLSYRVTLTNGCDGNVETPQIIHRWLENASTIHSWTDSIVLAPGESYIVEETDHVIHEDVVNGQVTFEYSGFATLQSTGETVLSNKATLQWLTEDTEPEPDPEGEYSLHLDVYHVYPKSEYVVDEYGNTAEIPFNLVVTNTGDLPVVFSDYTVSLNGVNYKMTEPAQYLKPNDSYGFNLYGTILNETQITPGTETTATLGIVTLTFTAHATHPEWTDTYVCDSNPVPMDHTLVEPGPWTPDLASLTIEKTETSYHLNPKGYMLNDLIDYQVTVTNTGDVAIPLVEVHDDHFDDGSGSDLLAAVTNLMPAEVRVVNFSYTVTQTDVDAKWVINNATAEWNDPVTGNPMTTPALPVKSPTTDEPLPGGLEIVKSVTGTPDNGSYYVPGEMIHFNIKVTNTMDVDIVDIWIYDALSAPEYISPLPAHSSYDWSYDYEATEMDAKILGYVSNIAYGGGFISSGYISGISNEVIVPVHFDPPKEAALLLTKTETSTPANGAYYVLDEEIIYTITAKNIGEAVLYDIGLYDSLDSPPFEYAHFGVLNPGESQSATYTYKVTQPDVDAGYVENWAMADYAVNNSDIITWYSAYAGPVISPTGEKTIIKKTTLPPGEADSCKLTLRGAGVFTFEEEQHYCATHKAAMKQVQELTDAAKNGAEKAAAWQQAVTIWRTALDTEYEELIKAAQGALRLTAAAEKVAFEKYIGEMNTMLQALYPDDAELVSRILCGVIEKQCTELCYLRRNAGKARPDSMYSGSFRMIENDTAAEKCAAAFSLIHSGDMMITRTQCADHGKIQETVLYLLKGTPNRKAAEDTFNRTRRAWQGGLDKATNLKYRAAQGDARAAVGTFRMAFDQLAEKRSDMLEQLYPANPEIVAEVISNMIRDQVLVLCGIW